VLVLRWYPPGGEGSRLLWRAFGSSTPKILARRAAMCRRGTAHASRRPMASNNVSAADVHSSRARNQILRRRAPPTTACPPRADPSVHRTICQIPVDIAQFCTSTPRTPCRPQGPVRCSVVAVRGRARAILGPVSHVAFSKQAVVPSRHAQHATRLLRACCGNVKLCKAKKSVKRSVAGIGIEKMIQDGRLCRSPARGCRTINGWQFRDACAGRWRLARAPIGEASAHAGPAEGLPLPRRRPALSSGGRMSPFRATRPRRITTS